MSDPVLYTIVSLPEDYLNYAVVLIVGDFAQNPGPHIVLARFRTRRDAELFIQARQADDRKPPPF